MYRGRAAGRDEYCGYDNVSADSHQNMTIFDNVGHALEFSLKQTEGKPSSAHRNSWNTLNQQRAEERLTIVVIVNQLPWTEKYALYCRYGSFLHSKESPQYRMAHSIFINSETGLKEELMLKYFRQLKKTFAEIGRENSLDRRRVFERYEEIKDKISPIEINATATVEEKLIKAGLI